MKRIKAGDTIPDFELYDQKGNLIRINDYFGKLAMVIFFYPKDETPGCTAQACSFRDQYDEFIDMGAEVFGISSDSSESHRSFAFNHYLKFHLLSDPDGKVRQMFGVPKTLGIIPGRVTFVVNKKGVVEYVYNSQLQFRKHVKKSLQILKKMGPSNFLG